jgi:hypothetical protein
MQTPAYLWRDPTGGDLSNYFILPYPAPPFLFGRRREIRRNGVIQQIKNQKDEEHEFT